jgi:GT2 family glycosyltransferase
MRGKNQIEKQKIKIMERVAILMTCYNRVETTLHCLEYAYKAIIPHNVIFDIYLVDDNSPDDTGKTIKQKYPKINVIMGTGSLYWNKGMRLAWKNASEHDDYDFYLWLNDDTVLHRNAFEVLFSDYYEISGRYGTSVIAGSCRGSDSEQMTYGGRTKNNKCIYPDNTPQPCCLINGNIVLVPKKIFDTIGILSDRYTHTNGDYDYGLRAIKAGFRCYTTSVFIAECDRNGVQAWQDPNIPLLKRIKYFYSPKGICLYEYIVFKSRYYGMLHALALVIGKHIKMLFALR